MPAVPSRKPRRLRRWLWPAAAAVLLGLWLARGPLLGPLVARLVASQVAAAAGGQVRIASADGGWLRDARLRGIEAQAPGWRVRARQITADYRPGLLLGDAAALDSVSVDGVEAMLDLDAAPPGAGGWPPALAQLPQRLPSLRLDGEVVLRAGGRELRLADLRLSIADGRAELAMRELRLDGRVFALPPLRFSRPNRETMRLDEPVELPLPGLHCEQLELTLGSTVQQLVAAGRLAGGTWQARVAAGEASIDLQRIDLAALGLLPQGFGPILVDGRIERIADGWAVRSLHASATGVSLVAAVEIASGPWRLRDLAATLSADLPRLRPGLAGRIQAEVRGDLPLASWSQGRVTVEVLGTDLQVGGQSCAPTRLAAQLEARAIKLLAVDGGWGGCAARLVPPAAAPVAAPAAGWLLPPSTLAVAGGTAVVTAHGDDGGAFSGEVQLDGVQLAQLPFAHALRHLRGTLAGSLRFGSGTSWSASCQVDGLEAKLSADVPTITAGRARLSAGPGVLEVNELHAELGGAGLDATGRIRLDGEANFALTCRGSNLLLVQRPDARVRADLDLQLGGSFAAPLLAGEVLVTSALITPELQGGGQGDLGDDRIVLFELPDPPLSAVRFALQVRSAAADAAERGVRVVTRWGRGTCDLDLRLGGTGALPAPEGRVSVRDGVATLPFSTLKVTHGELVFPPGDPFQPRLTATAGARIRNYDVQAQVTGTLSQPVLRVTGSGLDEQEAVMLLTTGSTPRELSDPQSQKAALGRVGVWLGQEAWRDLEGLDGVDDGPSLTERLVITWGRERSGQGRDTIDTEVELTEPGSDPAVLLYGERDRYDQYNAGVILRLSWGGDAP